MKTATTIDIHLSETILCLVGMLVGIFGAFSASNQENSILLPSALVGFGLICNIVALVSVRKKTR